MVRLRMVVLARLNLDVDIRPLGSHETQAHRAWPRLARKSDGIVSLVVGELAPNLVEYLVVVISLITGREADLRRSRVEDSREIAMLGLVVQFLVIALQRADKLLTHVVEDAVAVGESSIGGHAYPVSSPWALTERINHSAALALVMPTYKSARAAAPSAVAGTSSRTNGLSRPLKSATRAKPIRPRAGARSRARSRTSMRCRHKSGSVAKMDSENI